MIRLNRIESGIVEAKISEYLLNRYKEQVIVGYEPDKNHFRTNEEIEFIRHYLKDCIKRKTSEYSPDYYEESVNYLFIIDNIEDIIGNGMMDYQELYNQVEETSIMLNVSLLEELDKSTRIIDYIYDMYEGKSLITKELDSVNEFIHKHYGDITINKTTPKSVIRDVKHAFSEQFMNMQHNNIRIIKDREEIESIHNSLI